MQSQDAQTTISVVIPVHDSSAQLAECLDRLGQSFELPTECIVVDDGSTDGSADVAASHGCILITSPCRRGPAHARNLGAQAARGDILLFIDADVLPAVDCVQRVRLEFSRDDAPDALIGSYDDDPASPGFVSQYKNLMNCFVHQSARRNASTFWSGCGAIRRPLFLAKGGFDTAYDRPAIEDIELGYRLVAAGHQIRLDPDLTVKHLKHWTWPSLVRCEVFDRAVPWTELIWRDRRLPNDLNLQTSQRLSVASMALLVVASGLTAALAIQSGSLEAETALLPGVLGLWLLGSTSIVALNLPFFRFLARRRGLRFALSAIPLQIAFYAYGGFGFALGTARYFCGRVAARRPPEPLLAPEGRPSADRPA